MSEASHSKSFTVIDSCSEMRDWSTANATMSLHFKARRVGGGAPRAGGGDGDGDSVGEGEGGGDGEGEGEDT